MVERRTVNRGDGGSMPPTAVSKLWQFLSPHICHVSFGRDTKSGWSLLSGVYARGSKISHTGGKCVTCSKLTNSRWTLNAKGSVQYLKEEKRFNYEHPLCIVIVCLYTAYGGINYRQHLASSPQLSNNL